MGCQLYTKHMTDPELPGKMSITDGVPIIRDFPEELLIPDDQPTEEFDSAAVARGIARAVNPDFPETFRVYGEE